MAAATNLAELYEAVFGAPPSHTSQIVMRRMEEFLGLKAGDAFSRMLIVQLRCADRIEETRGQLHAIVEELRPLLITARTLTRELERSSGDVARRNRRIPAMEHAAEMVDAGRALPLFAYLAAALRPRRAYDDLQVRERRTAARLDLFLLAGIVGVAVMAGMALDRFGVSLHR